MRPIYFSLDELVCQHVYDYYGDQAWDFFDQRFLIIIDTIRERIGRPIFLNDWLIHGSQSQSGLRCPFCSIVKEKIDKGQMYMSAHSFGQAGDFHVQGMLPEETRQWIINNSKWWPYNIRLEEGVNWVHLDVRNYTDKKVITFKP
jgi:hypothetical protein